MDAALRDCPRRGRRITENECVALVVDSSQDLLEICLSCPHGQTMAGNAKTTSTEETMPPTKGTCTICQRTNITIAWRGACGVCSRLMKTGAIDPKSGSMTAEAVDKINELRALAGMEPLKAKDGEKKPAAQDQDKIEDSGPGLSAEERKVLLAEEAADQAQKVLDESFAALETASSPLSIDDERRLGISQLLTPTLGMTESSLRIDGQVLPLMPCRNASFDAPALSVHKSGKLLSLVLPGAMPEGCAFAQVFGSPGAEVLGFRLLAERQTGARKLSIKKGHKSLDIHSEGLTHKLGLKPGRYPLEIRGDGILVARLGKAVAS